MVFKKQGENLAGSNWLTIMLSGKPLPTQQRQYRFHIQPENYLAEQLPPSQPGLYPLILVILWFLSAGISQSTSRVTINNAHSNFNIFSTYSQRTQKRKQIRLAI